MTHKHTDEKMTCLIEMANQSFAALFQEVIDADLCPNCCINYLLVFLMTQKINQEGTVGSVDLTMAMLAPHIQGAIEQVRAAHMGAGVFVDFKKQNPPSMKH